MRIAVLSLICLAFATLSPAQNRQSRREARAIAERIIEVGRENWERPWAPDLRSRSRKIRIDPDRRIDVLILGDGYLDNERSRFERDVEAWYREFSSLTPWKQLLGVFRVRGYWTPSATRATDGLGSHYQLAGTKSNDTTAKNVFAAMEETGCNPAGRSGTLSHTTVIMLIRDARDRNPSGMTRSISGLRGTKVRIGFGAYTHHEFGHAYSGLRDEYILGEDSKSDGNTPARQSIFTLTNLSHTVDPERILWRHLMPGSPINPDQRSVIGVLWIGGIAEHGAWHSEVRCMMNGTHENWDLDKTRRGVGLRDRKRFCFWCEEVIVAKTWAKLGLLGSSSTGTKLYEEWVNKQRANYQSFFNVKTRINAQNTENRNENLGDAKIFERVGGRR
jgi:hypothetical protein